MQLNEALATFSDHLDDIKTACISNIEYIIETTPQQSTGEQRKWIEFLSKELGEPVEDIELELRKLSIKKQVQPIQHVIKRIVARQQHTKPQNTFNRITDDDIERAKEYPIKDLFKELVNTPIKGGMAKCPFHPDDTASLSLRFYNRYRCFGCDERGSVIDLYMKINNVDFIQAVKALI